MLGLYWGALVIVVERGKVLAWVVTKWVKKANTTQNTTTQHTTHNTTHTTTSSSHHRPAAFPSLYRPQAIGLVFAVIGLLIWGDKMRGIKKYREEGGALALKVATILLIHKTIQ